MHSDPSPDTESRGEPAPDSASQPDEKIYHEALTRPVSKPREWTIRRVETVIGSIA